MPILRFIFAPFIILWEQLCNDDTVDDAYKSTLVFCFSFILWYIIPTLIIYSWIVRPAMAWKITLGSFALLAVILAPMFLWDLAQATKYKNQQK